MTVESKGSVYSLVTLSEAVPYWAGGSSPQRGDVFVLSMDQPNILGRHPLATTIHVLDPRIARRHCQIEWAKTENTWIISELGAPNSTRVNSQMLGRNQVIELHVGDQIQCGNTVFQLTHEGEGPSPLSDAG